MKGAEDSWKSQKLTSPDAGTKSAGTLTLDMPDPTPKSSRFVSVPSPLGSTSPITIDADMPMLIDEDEDMPIPAWAYPCAQRGG